MIEIAHILAQGKDDGKWFNFVIGAAIFILYFAAQMYMKRERAKAAQEAEEQRRRSDAEKAGRPADRPDDLPQTAQQAKPYPPMPTARPEPITPEPVPVPPPPAAPVPVFPPPAALVPVFPEPVRAQAAAGQPPAHPRLQMERPAPRQPRTVEEEMARLQSRLRKLEHLRGSRLEMEASPEADTAAIEARLLSIRAATTGPTVAGRQLIMVNLSDPAGAQTAIIMHEIFSPPKALRHQQELWDTY